MADEELNQEEKAPASAAAGNIKLIIGGIVVIILAAGISFAVARMAAVSVVPPQTKAISGDAKIKTETIGSTYDAGEYVTNLAGGTNFIKVKIVFAFTNKDVEMEVSNKLPVIQHTINKVLREQSADALREPKAMEKLSEKMRNSINELLVKGNVDDVYFTNFVIQ